MVARHAASNSTHRFREALERPAEMAKEYPVSSMLVVFGVGLGVGVLLSHVACSSLEGMYHEPTFSERLSQQIYHAVNEVIPEAVRGQMARLRA